MLDSPQIDELRTYVDALPLDDQTILGLLAGLNGQPVIDVDDLPEKLGLKRGGKKVALKVARALTRLRLAMRLPETATDEVILESLVIGETRRRAQEMLAGKPKKEEVVHSDTTRIDEEPKVLHIPPSAAPEVVTTTGTASDTVTFDKLFKEGDDDPSGAPVPAPKKPKAPTGRAPAPMGEETPLNSEPFVGSTRQPGSGSTIQYSLDNSKQAVLLPRSLNGSAIS